MREKFKESQIPLHAPVPMPDPVMERKYEDRVKDLGGERHLTYEQKQQIIYDIRYGNIEERREPSNGRLPSDRSFD